MRAAMHHKLLALALALVALLPATASAGGKIGKKIAVSIHMESEASDNPKMIFTHQVQGKQRVFRRVPELSSKDILSQSAFPTQDGTYGVTLKLTERAATRWSFLTSANNSKWVACEINGRVCDVFLIDQQINDGMVVIWKNLTAAEVEELDKAYPRIGQEKGKKKEKK